VSKNSKNIHRGCLKN